MKNKIPIIILTLLLISSLAFIFMNRSKLTSQSEKSLTQASDCLHPDGRETRYSFVLKPYEQIKIYNQVGEAGNENVVSVYVNSIHVQNFSNHSAASFERQNTTPNDQFIEITSGMHFKKGDIGNNTIQLSFEDKPCTIHRGHSGGSHDRDPTDYEYCDCKGSEPDYNDAYLFIKKF